MNKRSQEFEGEQGEAYGRACREEGKWGKECDYIIISKTKGKKGKEWETTFIIVKSINNCKLKTKVKLINIQLKHKPPRPILWRSPWKHLGMLMLFRIHSWVSLLFMFVYSISSIAAREHSVVPCSAHTWSQGYRLVCGT